MADEPTRFRVFMPQVCRDQLRVIADEAERLGIVAEVEASIEQAEFRLRHEANDWGESREYLPVMKIEIRVGFTRTLTVWYGLHADTRVVYLRRFHLHGGAGES